MIISSNDPEFLELLRQVALERQSQLAHEELIKEEYAKREKLVQQLKEKVMTSNYQHAEDCLCDKCAELVEYSPTFENQASISQELQEYFVNKFYCLRADTDAENEEIQPVFMEALTMLAMNLSGMLVNGPDTLAYWRSLNMLSSKLLEAAGE